MLALILSLVTAFWFASIASHAKKDALANAKDEFSKEREKLRVNAERQKTRLIRKSHEEIRKETNRAHARSSFKLGAGFIGIVAAGSLMIFSQLTDTGFVDTGCRWWCAGRLSHARSARGRFEKIKRHLPSAMKQNLLLRLSLRSMTPAKLTCSKVQYS